MEDNNRSIVLSAPAVISDGNGGWQPCPNLLTPNEAVRYLRIDKLGLKNPLNTLKYYREKGLLKGTYIGNHLFYTKQELDKFIERMTKND